MKIGIVLFRTAGDVVNGTIATRQLKHTFPNSHITWFVSERYAFVLDNNPDVDEVVALPGDPFQLDAQIGQLLSTRRWDRFYILAPHLAYADVPGGDLTELMFSKLDIPLTVPLRPVVVLRPEEVQRARQWWSQLPANRPRILVETEFHSEQTPWDKSYALEMIHRLAPAQPVFVFTAKNCPPYLDELRQSYPDVVWCNLPFRDNAELYNLCDAFIGVASGISCLTNALWCREDVPHIEVARAPHWSTWHYNHHTRRRICFDRTKFINALEWLFQVIQGEHVPVAPEENTLLGMYTHSTDDKYTYLSPALVSDELNLISQRAITRTFEGIGPFVLCSGSLAEYLCALSTALDQSNDVTVVAYTDSVEQCKAFFDALPQVKKVYLIPRPTEEKHQATAPLLVRLSLPKLPNCHSCGVTPPTFRDEEFWKPGLDVVHTCKVTLYPTWVQRYKGEKLETPQVVLAPMGSLTGAFRSKRNIMPPHYWQSLLQVLRHHGIRPIVVGNPEESEGYPSDGWARDCRSFSFEEQFRLIASADVVIAADSWQKTFAAMAQVATIVFNAPRNHDLAFWKDPSHYALIEPWKNIHLVDRWDDFLHTLASLLAHHGIELDMARCEQFRPLERPWRQNPHQPLTTFHPVFWERNYERAHRVLIRIPDAVGDTLMLTAVVRALKKAYPHLHITVAGAPYAADIFRNNPDIAACVIANTPADIRAEANADVVVDYRFIIDQLPEYYGIMPMMDILANIAGVRLPSKQVIYTIHESERSFAQERTATVSKPIIALHLVSSKDTLRSYPKQQSLVEKLLDQLPDTTLLWLGTEPSPVRSERIIDCASTKLSLRQQIGLVQQCDLAITVDSAFFHIAHNLWHKPTVLLVGPTSEALIGNYAAAPIYTLRGANCSACYWHPNRCKRICMALISEQSIVAAAMQIIDRLRTGAVQQLPPPKATPVHCTWDTLQQNIFTACIHFRNSGTPPARIHLAQGRDRLPPYADRWNGIELISTLSQTRVSLSEVFRT
ncbi:MAG: glycosyltransferase family 9 protein [Bacteroidota bacterium]|nr:glycosyltransferase family 9 protein [Bacteroidota bacterium]